MVDFVGLLKRTIDAQSNASPALRQRIYDRTRETVEKQMAGKALPPDIMALQRRVLEKAIEQVEAFYLDTAAAAPPDIFTALQQNAGMKTAPSGFAPAEPSGGGALPRLGRYGAYSDSGADDNFTESGAYGHLSSRQSGAVPAAAYPPRGFDISPPAAPPQAGGNAYFARAHGPASATQEAAYGGSFAGGAGLPPSLADSRRNEAGRSGFFSFEDEERAAEQRPAAAGRFGAETADSIDSYEKSGAFARRALDEPVAALPDEFADYGRLPPQNSGSEQAGAQERFRVTANTAHYAAGRPQESAGREAAARGAGLYADFSDTLSPYGEEAAAAPLSGRDDRPSETRAPSAPPSPYHLEQENISENFTVRDAQDKQDYRQDFSSLHNFLFGDDSAQTPAELPQRGAPFAQADTQKAASFPAPEIAFGAAETPPEAETDAARGRDAFSPLPDFLLDGQHGGQAETDNPAESAQDTAFNLEQALSAAAGGAEKTGERAAAEDSLPEDFLNFSDSAAADVLLPEMRDGKAERRAAQNPEGDDSGNLALSAGSSVVSGIFAQAAIREKRRSGKKRLLTGGLIILALLVIFAGIFWFLTDFLKNDRHRLAALVGQTAPAEEQQKDKIEKTDQRLTADGQEVTAAPPPQAAQTTGAGVEAAAQPAQAEESAAVGAATFREAQTALMPATAAQGQVRWALLHEKTPTGSEDTVLRGEVSIPSKDIIARMTVRPNHDTTIPAVYLVEMMFIVPENFEGVAVDKISPLMFKATDSSTGQELQDTRVYKINDNFFVVTLNTPEPGRNPKLQRNIALMEQLPWLTMNVAYKNGRIGELTFAKGAQGDALFKQFFDAAPPPSAASAPQAAAPAAPKAN